MARAQATPKQEHRGLEISHFSLTELLDLKDEIEREVRSRQAKEVEELRVKVAETAHTFGMSVEEMMGFSHKGKRVTRHPRGKQPAKYRGPNGEEWSGRGPNPRWMKPLLEKGKTKEDFLIK